MTMKMKRMVPWLMVEMVVVLALTTCPYDPPCPCPYPCLDHRHHNPKRLSGRVAVVDTLYSQKKSQRWSGQHQH